MTTRDSRVNGWAQSALLPPEHLRIEVLVHIEAGAEIAQVGVHCSDHISEVVLGIHVTKVSLRDGTDELEAMVSELVASALSEHYMPF